MNFGIELDYVLSVYVQMYASKPKDRSCCDIAHVNERVVQSCWHHIEWHCEYENDANVLNIGIRDTPGSKYKQEKFASMRTSETGQHTQKAVVRDIREYGL